jgi:pyruvate/2-oxoglutarate dehydrogenase complex dihydrolipoamide dehydrogenase (E3) component
MAEETLTPDLCVIGGGAAGATLAASAAAAGVPVVLIERDRVGGANLHRGSVPAQALIAVAKRVQAIRQAASFGIAVGEPEIDFGRVRAQVQKMIASLAPNDSETRLAALGVRLIKGEARFIDAMTVQVDNLQVRARRFVLATGSSPIVPPIPGLAETPYLTSDSIFALDERPRHLLVLGAGPTGLELAQAFRRLGAQVSVLEAARPLDQEDSECAGIVLEALTREGIAIRSGVEVERIERVRRSPGSVHVAFSSAGTKGTIEGSHLLLATGRRPNIEGLGLEAAGIAYDAHGIHVGRNLRTANRRVYAIGDAAGGLQLTHLARWHARLVLRNVLFRARVKAVADWIPRVIFTDPELAQVGLREDEARRHHGRIHIQRWPYRENDRAEIEHQGKGMIKLVTTRKGRILGVSIVGAEAGELVGTWALAIAKGMNVRTLADLVLPYPTRSEIGQKAALNFFARSLTNRWVRRIIRAVRAFG